MTTTRPKRRKPVKLSPVTTKLPETLERGCVEVDESVTSADLDHLRLTD